MIAVPVMPSTTLRSRSRSAATWRAFSNCSPTVSRSASTTSAQTVANAASRIPWRSTGSPNLRSGRANGPCPAVVIGSASPTATAIWASAS